MGFCAEKVALVGLFGGLNRAKNGKVYLSILSEGPKVDKVQIDDTQVVVPPGVVFGTPVCANLSHAEQKFQDYNGSFSVCKTVLFSVPK